LFDSQASLIEILSDEEEVKMICIHIFRNSDHIVSVTFPLNFAISKICNRLKGIGLEPFRRSAITRIMLPQTIRSLCASRFEDSQPVKFVVFEIWSKPRGIEEAAFRNYRRLLHSDFPLTERSQIWWILKLIGIEKFSRHYPAELRDWNYERSTKLTNQPSALRAQRLSLLDFGFVVTFTDYLSFVRKLFLKSLFSNLTNCDWFDLC
jgi:hypothetical protein